MQAVVCRRVNPPDSSSMRSAPWSHIPLSPSSPSCPLPFPSQAIPEQALRFITTELAVAEEFVHAAGSWLDKSPLAAALRIMATDPAFIPKFVERHAVTGCDMTKVAHIEKEGLLAGPSTT